MRFLSTKYRSPFFFYPIVINTLILICGINIFFQIEETECLEMTLDRTRPRSSDARAACFLDCEENLEISTSSHINITRLSVFKKVPHAYSDNDSSEKGNLVASLTRDEPSLSRVSDDNKVDGVLEAKRSTLHIDMFKKSDCSAAYTCEVQTVDSNGNIHTGVNRLRQQQIQNEGSNVASMMSSSASIQLLSLTHQLDTKLALLGQSFGFLQDKVDSIERRLDGRMWSIEQKIDNFKNHIVNKVQSLEKGLNSLMGQMQSSKYTSVLDKLCQFEDKIAEGDTQAGDTGEKKQDVYTRDLPALGKFENQIRDLENVLRSLNEEVSQLQVLEKQNQEGLQNLVTDMVDISTSCKEASQNVGNSSSHSLLEGSTKNFADTIASSLQSTMSGLLLPKACKKGMSPFLSHLSYPYVVVIPDEDSNIGPDVPYLCDAITDRGGWIVIQRRVSGDIDFYRSWSTYKEGFGSLSGDFWIGNEMIHRLTSAAVYVLRVEMKYKGRSAYANYDKFSLDSEQSKYTLRVGKYSGTAGESLEAHNGEPFTTFDRDHDLYDRNCAKVFSGAWWYKACHTSNLNGKWQAAAYKGPNWQTLSNGDPVSFTEMKIRRKDK